MSKQYFTTITTKDPAAETALRNHSEKLSNYLQYNYAGSNADKASIKVNGPQPRTRGVEIHSQSTTMTVKGHDLIILTVLCCEDEEENEYKG